MKSQYEIVANLRIPRKLQAFDATPSDLYSSSWESNMVNPDDNDLLSTATSNYTFVIMGPVAYLQPGIEFTRINFH